MPLGAAAVDVTNPRSISHTSNNPEVNIINIANEQGKADIISNISDQIAVNAVENQENNSIIKLVPGT